MIAKMISGKGFRGAANYLLLKYADPANKKGELIARPEATIIGGNMAGLDPRQLSAEFAISRQLKPNIKNPVFHVPLRLPKGEHLTDQQWNDVGADYMKAMGFKDNHQYVIVKHDHPDGEHVHILASTINLSGKVNPLRKTLADGKYEQSYKTSLKAIQAIEKKFGLTVAVKKPEPGQERAAALKPLAPSPGQYHQKQRTGVTAKPVDVSKAVASCARDCGGNIQAFVEQLRFHGVSAMPNIAETGKLSGFSFQANGQTYKGGDIGFKMEKLGKAMGLPKSPEGFYLSGETLTYALELKALKTQETQAEIAKRIELEQKHYPDLKNSITADETGEPKPSKRRRTLEIKFNPTVSPEAPTRQIYRWNPDGSIAFIVDPNKISFRNKSDTAYRAGVQKMKDLGWKSCTITGDDQFKSKMWIECQLQGMPVTNYQPTPKDEAALKAALEAKATGQWKKPIAIPPPEPAKPAPVKAIPVAKPAPVKPADQEKVDTMPRIYPAIGLATALSQPPAFIEKEDDGQSLTMASLGAMLGVPEGVMHGISNHQNIQVVVDNLQNELRELAGIPEDNLIVKVDGHRTDRSEIQELVESRIDIDSAAKRLLSEFEFDDEGDDDDHLMKARGMVLQAVDQLSDDCKNAVYREEKKQGLWPDPLKPVGF